MSVSAARRDHRSFCQYDVVYPIEHRTNLANAGSVHDGRFPHSDEVVWRQLLFRVCQSFPWLRSTKRGKWEQRKSASCPSPQSAPTGGDYGGIGAVVRDLDLLSRAVRGPGMREPGPWQIAPYHTVSRDSQQRALRMHEWRAHREL